MGKIVCIALIILSLISTWESSSVDASCNTDILRNETSQSLQSQRPLTLSQIEELIAVQTPDAAIAIEIKRRGIAFEMTPQELERLRTKGVGSKTLEALENLRSKKGESPFMPTNKPPKLWITYAWKNNAGGDFDFLVQELRKTGIDVRFDKIELVPGQLLWTQIAARIEDAQLDGWAILLTKESLESKACREELAYALDRALSSKGKEFPLIGLLRQVSISDVPAPLRVRLCVDLRNPQWAKDVRAGLERQPSSTSPSEILNFKVQIHNAYQGNPNLKAVEFASRLGEIRNWAIAYSDDGPQPIKRGVGATGGGDVMPILESIVEGTVDINGKHMKVLGAGSAITPSTSAYIVFEQKFPVSLFFGYSDKPFDIPSLWWQVKLQ